MRKACTVVAAVLLLSAFTAAASNPAILLPATDWSQWQVSVGVETYAAYDPAASWLDVTSTPSGGVTLRRSALCPDHYPWPRMTYDKPVTVDLLLTPYVYFDISYSGGMENSGWMIQLTFNDNAIIPLPQAMVQAAGRVPSSDINKPGGGGKFVGRLNLRELIESYRPALVENTYILELTRCDIIIYDEGRYTQLTVNALHFGLQGPSSWAVPEVVLAQANGLSSESVERNYQADITRAQYAELSVLLYEKLTGKPAVLPPSNPFTDTDDPMILKAYHAGIVLGIGDGLFAPDRAITRAELAVMLQRTVSVASPEKYGTVKIEPAGYLDDEGIRSWAREAVDFVTAGSIMQGSNNRFMPGDLTSCEQAILTNWRSWVAMQ